MANESTGPRKPTKSVHIIFKVRRDIEELLNKNYPYVNVKSNADIIALALTRMLNDFQSEEALREFQSRQQLTGSPPSEVTVMGPAK